ncbi:hypothetical protein PsYK624_130790 [Phanerochaete sordida]|uniref:Uncharacterized protein n=1 Tax=Phanerochaete sordida TaxID=48140 RepID=A0A9P3GKE9_9APHY|nr:hypothetical protein PsYK624_130790 [Phanerochaete sordida]
MMRIVLRMNICDFYFCDAIDRQSRSRWTKYTAHSLNHPDTLPHEGRLNSRSRSSYLTSADADALSISNHDRPPPRSTSCADQLCFCTLTCSG